MVDGVLGITCNPFDEIFRQHLAGRAFDANHAHAGEEVRRAAFVFDHMGFRMTEGEAAGARDTGKRQGVGSGAGRDEEDGDFALEDLVEALLDGAVQIAGAVGSGKAG